MYRKYNNKYYYNSSNYGTLDFSSDFNDSDYIELRLIVNIFSSSQEIFICSFKKIRVKKSSIEWVACSKIDDSFLIKSLYPF